MISKERPKKVKIHITTYLKQPTNKLGTDMSKQGTQQHSCRNDHNSRFICSICLNTNTRDEEPKKYECDRRKSRSCPICQGTSDINAKNSYETINEYKGENKLDDSRTKNIQTSRTNVDQGLNLLNEVLTVFQNKKDHNVKVQHSKTVLLKDACVSAKLGINKPKLSVSKIFQLSIEEGGIQESGKFSVVNCCQPKLVRSQYSIDLIKHKSSSIPQMKMDELKNSLKEKSKTNKDAIEEVNRMFATVKRDESFDNSNRPMIRNGPRVLPVVKTFCKQSQRQSDEDISDQSNKAGCKCCQTNYYMSSGDSLAKQERCEKNVYMHCCHKNKSRDVQTEVLICERCRKPGYGFD